MMNNTTFKMMMNLLAVSVVFSTTVVITAFTTTRNPAITTVGHLHQQHQQQLSELWYKNEGDEENDDDDSFFGNGETTDVVAMNVLGTGLRQCCSHDGEFCNIRDTPEGTETVCCQVTQKFLTYAKDNSLGSSDLTQGLKPGDIGCITVDEWAEAYNNGVAPYLFLESTHERTLEHVMLDFLQVFAIDLDQANSRLDGLNDDRARLENMMM
jgi:uncharacterized protein (DUF2237 family)